MRAADLARALKAVRSGRQWKCRCVAHEDSSPSMIIYDGHDEGKVQVRCLAGCSSEEIIRVLESRGLWGDDKFQIDWQKQREREQSAEEKKEHRLRVLARQIFDDAKPIKGSMADRYFESRDLGDVARMIDDIRYHTACPRGSGVQPAVVIAMRSVATNSVVAIQRLFLTRQAKKDGKGMMLGPAGGAAMKLQLLQNSKLHICEGLETGLAIIAMDHGPVWAVGSKSNIQSFSVIDTVTDLTIWSDPDFKPDAKNIISPGIDAAEQCCMRWRAAGRTCKILKAKTLNNDAADVWSARNARL